MTLRWRENAFLIETPQGPREVRGWTAFAFGLVQSPFGFWCPVHLPTRIGICPGTEFPTLERAQDFCQALLPLVEDWTMLTLEQARAMSAAIVQALAAAAHAHGCVHPLYPDPERIAS